MQKNQVKHFPIFIKKKLQTSSNRFIIHYGIKYSLIMWYKKSCNSKEFTLRKHCINMLMYSFIFPCQIPVTLQKSKSN